MIIRTNISILRIQQRFKSKRHNVFAKEINKAASTRSNQFDQISLTHFLNQKLQYQIRCLHNLKQTNEISFKELGNFDS